MLYNGRFSGVPWCCQKNLDYCGSLLRNLGCDTEENANILPNHLYTCFVGKEPVLKKKCTDMCMDGGADHNDSCAPQKGIQPTLVPIADFAILNHQLFEG